MKTERDTAAFKIFHVKFHVMIPEMCLYTEAQLQHQGLYIMDDVEADTLAAMTLQPAFKTIAEIAELHSQGHQISIPKVEDCTRIYDIIMEHLYDCRDFINSRGYKKPPPLDELRKLDNLAADIYTSAKVDLRREDKKASAGIFEIMAGRSVMGTERTYKVEDKHESPLDNINKDNLERAKKWR